MSNVLCFIIILYSDNIKNKGCLNRCYLSTAFCLLASIHTKLAISENILQVKRLTLLNSLNKL